MLQRYHFDVGDSNVGPIGFCAAVWAHSPEEALKLLNQALPEDQEVGLYDTSGDEGEPYVEYCQIYFGPGVTTANIDEVTED